MYGLDRVTGSWYPPSMRARGFFTSLLLACSWVTTSYAEAPGGTNDDNQVSYERPPVVRRGGFAMGATVGPGLSDFSGYPNTVEALSDPEREASTGATLGNGFSAWVGGTPRDFVTLGLGVAGVSSLVGDVRGSALGFVLHAEVYPLFALGGPLQDLGLSLDGGPGFASMRAEGAAADDDALAEGGATSFLSLGAFYEALPFWHMSLGPAFQMTHAFSQTITVNQFQLGIRLSFYGEQPPEPSPEARGRTSAAR